MGTIFLVGKGERLLGKIVLNGLTEYSIDGMFHEDYYTNMEWEVEYTDEFGSWWDTLSEEEQISIDAVVRLLERFGPALGYPYSSAIQTSRHSNLRELRIQHGGRPLRALYAFDPRRTAILLIGGDKTGKDNWYKSYVPVADRLYDEHIDQLKNEGVINGDSI